MTCMTTAAFNYTVRAGNSGTLQNERGIVVRVKVGNDPLDLTGNEIVFRVLRRGGAQVLRKTTESGVTVDLETAEIVVPITVADSRALEVAGLGLTYDIERRAIGLQRTIVAGSLFVEPGANDDA